VYISPPKPTEILRRISTKILKFNNVAFRKSRDCGEGEPYSKKENMARNKSLLSKLKMKGYSVTSLKGYYPEGGKESKEESFFVVDISVAALL
jgi:hypothetical protein